MRERLRQFLDAPLTRVEVWAGGLALLCLIFGLLLGADRITTEREALVEQRLRLQQQQEELELQLARLAQVQGEGPQESASAGSVINYPGTPSILERWQLVSPVLTPIIRPLPLSTYTPLPTYTPMGGTPSSTQPPVDTVIPKRSPTATETPTAIAGLVVGSTPTVLPTPTPITNGRMEIEYPDEMVVHHDEPVTVEILVAPLLAQLGSPVHASGVITVEQVIGGIRRIPYQQMIQLYPEMSVELVSSGFDIVLGDEDQQRIVNNGGPTAVWTWSITPTKAGPHNLTFNVFGRSSDQLHPMLVASISRRVAVLDMPPLEKLKDALFSNWVLLLVALVGTSGPLGLWINSLNYRLSKQEEERKGADEERNKKVADLEEERHRADEGWQVRVAELEQDRRRADEERKMLLATLEQERRQADDEWKKLVLSLQEQMEELIAQGKQPRTQRKPKEPG